MKLKNYTQSPSYSFLGSGLAAVPIVPRDARTLLMRHQVASESEARMYGHDAICISRETTSRHALHKDCTLASLQISLARPKGDYFKGKTAEIENRL